tara:strand:- start:46 stop:168 length:123 start_codon:yes stop_codon:yes gene_type:complete
MKSLDGFRVLNLTRDLWIMRINEGFSEIQRNIIAGYLLAH